MDKNTVIPSNFLRDPVHLAAFGFYAGLAPRMPGTVGTLVGILFYLPMAQLSWLPYLILTLILFLLGIWICGYTAKNLGVHDHSGIVWDEIVGFLIAMFMVAPTYLNILLGFILFRFFDILKPWPIAYIDRRLAGGIGIMLDDVLAGIYTLIIMQAIIHFQ